MRDIHRAIRAYVRHPIYAGAALLTFAMPVALGSLWGLLAAAIAIPALIGRIHDEERTLWRELERLSAKIPCPAE